MKFVDYAQQNSLNLREVCHLFTPATATIADITVDELRCGTPDTRRHIKVEFEVAVYDPLMRAPRPYVSPLYLWPSSSDPQIRHAACRAVTALMLHCGANPYAAEVDETDPTQSMYDILRGLIGKKLPMLIRPDDIPAKWAFLVDKYECWD